MSHQNDIDPSYLLDLVIPALDNHKDEREATRLLRLSVDLIVSDPDTLADIDDAHVEIRTTKLKWYEKMDFNKIGQVFGHFRSQNT